MLDLSGFPKDRYYLYRSHWSDKPMVHILPHWTWDGMEGEKIPVFCYTTGDEVELFLNGKSLGRKKKGKDLADITVLKIVMRSKIAKRKKFKSPYRLRWDVPYKPGTLKAVAYKNGKVIATDVVKTAGKPAKLELISDKKVLKADGYDLVFITVNIKDKENNFCPLADNEVEFSITGPGKIEAVGNGDPTSLESFKANHRKAFNGKCLLIIRSERKKGKISVKAYSEDLQGAELTIYAK